MLKIALVDNYDSFTYNLKHYLEAEADVDVFRNDKLKVSDLESYDLIVLSPGPGLPKDAGFLMEIIERYHATKPMLGICLGMQAMFEYFGGSLYNLEKVQHGIAAVLDWYDPEASIYANIQGDVEVGRYHSWAVRKEYIPEHIRITAERGEVVMSMESNVFPCTGIQYHPESVLTPMGKKILQNWLSQYSREV